MNNVSFPKLGLEFNLKRYISVFGFDIAWYAIIIALGLILALIYAMRRMKSFGLNPDKALDAILVGIFGGIIGARLYYVIFSWDNYKDDLVSIFKIREGGLAIYGGIIGSVLFGVIMCKILKIKILPMLDIASLGFLIGQGIGRWGNFVNAEAFGGEYNGILGMSINGGATVHPCFLYESVWCLLGFVLLHIYSKRRRFDGEVVLLYLIWYGLGRAFIEGMRSDSLYLGSFRVSQVLSVLIVIAALITIIVVRSKIRRNNDPEYLKLYVDVVKESQTPAYHTDMLNIPTEADLTANQNQKDDKNESNDN